MSCLSLFSFFLAELEKCIQEQDRLAQLFIKHVSVTPAVCHLPRCQHTHFKISSSPICSLSQHSGFSFYHIWPGHCPVLSFTWPIPCPYLPLTLEGGRGSGSEQKAKVPDGPAFFCPRSVSCTSMCGTARTSHAPSTSWLNMTPTLR